jgi:sortase (surface protein transpeptidase)
VILGHVDSLQGPAVFYHLSELHPGDRITVVLDDGTRTDFVVRSIRVYPNADFPGHKVYRRHGPAELNLVTCGGAYDAARGGYQANVVVNARKV